MHTHAYIRNPCDNTRRESQLYTWWLTVTPDVVSPNDSSGHQGGRMDRNLHPLAVPQAGKRNSTMHRHISEHLEDSYGPDVRTPPHPSLGQGYAYPQQHPSDVAFICAAARPMWYVRRPPLLR